MACAPSDSEEGAVGYTPIPKAADKPQPPPGLKAIIDHLHTNYPDQPNPLQVTTLLKYWLGGNEPLDYISMYHNPGNPDRGIAAHWHYISFGLSDLHGDERVHVRDKMKEYGSRSGMGFEITFRLLKTETEIKQQEQTDKPLRPPTWPANLLQSIARYCFQTGNNLCPGDNIPWRKSLDGSLDSEIQNILIAQDPQLGCIETPHGIVQFCQIVGVTEEEVERAAQWNGRGVLNFLCQDTNTGGEMLITDMQRTKSVFELFPETIFSLVEDLEKQGSDLAGINADFTFREIYTEYRLKKEEIDSEVLNEQCLFEENNRQNNAEIKCEEDDNSNNFLTSTSANSNSLQKYCPLEFQSKASNCISLTGIEITLDPCAAKFLILAVKDRIRHGRHFTFKSQNLALTLVSESVTGSVVSTHNPYAVFGYWIQVLITDDVVPRMIADFQTAGLGSNNNIMECIEFEWPDKKLKIIVDGPRTNVMSSALNF